MEKTAKEQVADVVDASCWSERPTLVVPGRRERATLEGADDAVALGQLTSDPSAAQPGVVEDAFTDIEKAGSAERSASSVGNSGVAPKR